MSIRLPAAFRFLGIAVAGWLGWRVPIAFDEIAAARAARQPVHQVAAAGVLALVAAPVATRAGSETARVAEAGGAVLRPRLHEAGTWLSVPKTPADSGRQADGGSGGLLEMAIPAAAASSTEKDGAAQATRGYARLREGDRRAAALLLAEAAAVAPDDPRAPAWIADRRSLTAHWQGYAAVHARRGGAGAPLSGLSPSLGGSQAVARLGYTLDPLADARLSLAGRMFAPLKGSRIVDGRNAQAALGVEFQPSRALPMTFAVERYIALGAAGRDAWSLRVSAGVDDRMIPGGLRLSAYGDAGIIGARSRDIFAEGQAVVVRPFAIGRTGRLGLGAGVWAARQPGVSRVDLGPSLTASAMVGRARIGGSVDYRLRVAGNARPGSGPAVTVQAGF